MVGRSGRFHLSESLALALLLAAVPLQAQAQEAPDLEPDFQAVAIDPSAGWVLDLENAFTFKVANKRAVPQVPIVLLQATAQDGATATLFENPVPIRGSETETVGGTWDGRDANGLPVKGPLALRLSVQPASGEDATPEDNVRTAAHVMDFRAVSLTLSGTSPDAVQPGATAHALLQVANTGSLDDAAALSLSEVPGWEFTLSATQVALPRSDPVRAVLLSMKASPEAPAGSAATVNVTARSPNPPGPEAMQAVATPAVAAGGWFDFSFPTGLSATPGSTAAFDVTVRSQRNRAETVAFQMAPEGSTLSSSVSPAEPVAVAAGATQAFRVEIPVPAGQPPGLHQWRPTLTGPGLEPQAAASLVTLQVPQVRSPTLEILSVPDAFEPGVDNAVQVRLGNGGNAQEAIGITALEMPSGWTLRGAVPVPLDAQATVVQDLVVSIPGSAPSGQHIVRLAPVASDGTRGGAVALSRPLAERTSPQVEPDLPRLLVVRDHVAHANVTLRNAGNKAGDFTLVAQLADAEPSGWSSSVDATGPFSLAAGATRTVKLTLRAPDKPLEADSGATVSLLLRDEADPARVGASIVRGMPPFPDLAVRWAGTVPGVPYKGHPLQAQLVVGNQGTAASPPGMVRVALSETAGGAPFVSTDAAIPALDWRPGANETTLVLTIPSDRSSTAVATVDPELQLKEADEANNGASGAIALRTFNVVVEKAADRTVVPGQAVALDAAQTFRVRNLGTAPETVRIEAVVQPPEWRPFSNQTVLLAPGQGLDVPVVFLMPASPGAAAGTVTVRAVHAELPALAAAGTVHIRLLDSAGPTITGVAANRTAVTGSGQVRFEARITDAVGIDAAGVVIVSPAGAVQRVAMKAGSGDTYSAEATLAGAGRHSWHVWARDRATPANLRDTSATPQSVLVEVDRNPVLHRVGPAADQPAKPGTFLVVTVAGPAPLLKADYTVDGTARSLAAASPLNIDTSGLGDGLHSVAVNVIDTAGGAATATFPVLIDGTPPVLADLALTPATPPLHQARLRVTDASEVDVSMRLLGRSGSGTQVELVRSGDDGDAYSAQFEMPEDVEEVRFVLQDAAGNVALLDHSIRSLLGPSTQRQESPAAGPLCSVGLLALAAVLARRRGLP